MGVGAQRSEEQLLRWAAQNHGLITHEAMELFGFPSRSFEVWIRRGRIESLYRGVARLAGSEATWLSSVHAVSLAYNAVVAGPTAGRIWGLDGCNTERAFFLVKQRT